MRKITITAILVSLITAVAVYAQTGLNNTEDSVQLATWETLAEQGDTAAMHRLLEFYDENAWQEIVRELTESEKEHYRRIGIEDATDTIEIRTNEHYVERLDYWLNKGLAKHLPFAYFIKGMRLYYEDEAEAVSYLSKAADAGNAQAALFCGSACLNQRRENDAFKYLSLAYRLGAPSAGWHLAMCYAAGIGTSPDREKAIEAMRHSAMMNYPEAVLEMQRIEPDNKVWQHKADSLDIQFSDFPIISY